MQDECCKISLHPFFVPNPVSNPRFQIWYQFKQSEQVHFQYEVFLHQTAKKCTLSKLKSFTSQKVTELKDLVFQILLSWAWPQIDYVVVFDPLFSN